MDSIKSQMEVLSEDLSGNVNYVSWRFKLNLTLKSKDVKAWIKQDLEAQTVIGFNVSSGIAIKIANCHSSQQMLDKLHALYGKKSELTIEGLQRQFFSYQYDVSKSVIGNCLAIQQYAEDLIAEGEDVKESWIMTRILGMLPPKLHHFRTAWDNVTGADKNLNTMFERLRLEEDRLSEYSNVTESFSQNALVSHATNGKSTLKGRSDGNTNGECFKCGKMGHIKKFCRNKPCAKYLEFCKKNYSCNNCHQKGHFAKECHRQSYRSSEEPSRNPSRGDSSRRALITTSLTSADMSNINSQELSCELWYQDCAASQHMTSHREWLKNYIKLDDPKIVVIGDATRLEGIGVGDVDLEAFNGKEWYKIVLKNVLHVPKMTFNLFSVTQLLDKHYIQCADANQSIFKTFDGKDIVAVAQRDGSLFKMMFRQENICLMSLSIKTWHERLGHQNIKYVRDVLKRDKIKFIDDWNDYVCPGCVYGKQHRISHPINKKTTEKPLDLIHVDLCEMNMKSLGGAKYFLLFKDDFTHFRTVYFLKTKDEAASKLDVFLNQVENQFERRVKCLRSDNGTEIRNAKTKELLEKLGVFHSKSSAYTPQQNGRIEREMRTVVESARSAIHGRKLNENLWAEAVNYAVFTLNQSGTSTLSGKSPADLWYGRRLDLKQLKSFGCDCYVLLQEHQRAKTEKKSKKGIFVGYNFDAPSYRVYIPQEHDVVSSCNVVFDETSNISEIETSLKNQESRQTEEEDISSETESLESDTNEENPDDMLLPTSTVVLRNRRTIKPPTRYKDYVMDDFQNEENLHTALIGEIENISVSEALENRNWYKAMEEEFDSLIKMKTWNLVQPPENVKPLTCRWIFRQKQDGKFKARLVVRGFEQKQGFDYFETFSPVARHVSVRLILSLASSNHMKLKTFDVKTAFLYGDLREDIYMYQPEGFDDGTHRICKLNKSLYGLKQAPRNWNEKFSMFLMSIGLDNTDDDPCIYYTKDKSIIIALFVDDGLIAGKIESDMINILNRLKLEFEITFNDASSGNLSYLGMQICCNGNKIFVNQSIYTETILKRFNFEEVSIVSTPMEKGMITSEENYVGNRFLDKTVPYREAIGSLLYLATISRPDISFAVNYLSRFNNKPKVVHWKMIKRVFQYLRGTVNNGIMFDGDTNLLAYTDSDYGGDSETGHSTSGVLILRGGPIVWYAQKQRLVATSTAEAEYRAAVSSIDDICWIRRIGQELGFVNIDEPTTLCVDNRSAIHMLQNVCDGKVTKGKKHVEISRKFIQEHIGKTINLKHVKSCDQLADILTKPLSRKTFQELKLKIIKEE